jgi:lysophospholipase L1-like esterase
MFDFLRFGIFIFVFFTLSCSQQISKHGFIPSKENVRFVGRFDFSGQPKIWAPGGYVEFWFRGSNCEVEIIDDPAFNSHNYIEVKVDDNPVKRIKLEDSENLIPIFKSSQNKVHHVYIVKCTEAGIGSISFGKIYCDKLVKPKKKQKLLFEFIGDSMTCGNGADCNSSSDIRGDWYEQHDAFQSYGPTLSRFFNADWMLSSVSGYGLTRSCCGNDETIPEIYDYADLGGQEYKYDWKKHQPDVVFICLGQNDGLQYVEEYCFDYVGFVKRIKKHNPDVKIVCLDSPMAKPKLKNHLMNCIQQAVNQLKKLYGNTIQYYFFKKRYHHGRLQHPNIKEHQQMASELQTFLLKSNILK